MSKQAAGTIGLHMQIDAELCAAFLARLAADGKTATRQVERWIARWLRVATPVRPGRGRPRKMSVRERELYISGRMAGRKRYAHPRDYLEGRYFDAVLTEVEQAQVLRGFADGLALPAMKRGPLDP